MSVDEFREICNEVFERIPIPGSESSDGTQRYKQRLFPNGCDDCTSENEWDCIHDDIKTGDTVICAWREKYWKYDEVKKFIALEKSQCGGLDLNRIESFSYLDAIKLGILKEYL
jgi:hypothetical protein